jgi:3-oxoacyl-[acyl-carrier protein] reductase
MNRKNVRFDFTGAVALVTGASQGIGLEIARLLARSGAQVGILDVTPPPADGTAAEDLADATIVSGDVSEPASAARAVEELQRVAGTPTILVNNAGILRDGVTWKLTDEQWRATLDVHLTGTFNLMRAAIPGMRAEGWGRIVNTTSFSGLHGNFGQANYSAAKAGIVGLTKATAKEVGRFGITVNAVSPNARTQMVEAIPEARRTELEAQIALGRFGEPAEMAPAVAFLASEEAGYITGAVLPVDGGLSM